jgi:hypothetical protein
MALNIRRATYFYTTVKDRPGEAYKLLSQLAAKEVNLLAFNAVPMGTAHTQLVLFPDHEQALIELADKLGLVLLGPHHALLVHGDDELGALVDIHGALYDGNINIYASAGVTNNQGSFGYVIYVNPEDFDRAAQILEA